jgi:hypothetical protein
MPKPWARGFGLTQQRTWEDVSGTVPVSLMGSAGLMISDMADINTQNEKLAPGVANAVFAASQRS